MNDRTVRPLVADDKNKLSDPTIRTREIKREIQEGRDAWIIGL
jgi:hypothetical protein